MAIKVKVLVRNNHVTNEKIASAMITDLQSMDFSEFCEYLAQDSTVGAADVSAVMTQLEKKLPLLLSLGTKVQISQEGMMVTPTVSGSLTQSQLRAKLEAKKAAGDDTVDTSREIVASDLRVDDLKAGVNIDFSKKFQSSFALNAKLKRVNVATAEASTDASGDKAEDGTSSSGDASQGGSSSSEGTASGGGSSSEGDGDAAGV